MFEWIEKEKHITFLIFAFGSLFAFWLIAWGLVKLKGMIYPMKRIEKLTKEKVYKKVSEIPNGRFSTYKLIANSLGSKAYQFIGNCLQNHDCQINSDGTVSCSGKTSCYRVIKHDYSLGGFIDSEEDKHLVKKNMLEKEGIGFEWKRGKWFVKEKDRKKIFTFDKNK